MPMQCFFDVEVNFQKKKFGSYFPIENFQFLVLVRNTIMLQHLIIQFSFYSLSSGRLREVKTKEISKCLREVVAYCLQKVAKIVIDLETFGILEKWSLRRSGRLLEVVATGGSTV